MAVCAEVLDEALLIIQLLVMNKKNRFNKVCDSVVPLHTWKCLNLHDHELNESLKIDRQFDGIWVFFSRDSPQDWNWASPALIFWSAYR